jgi:3-phenylpropionate/trans-cinnamate dioxygenase ferredoxin subunit
MLSDKIKKYRLANSKSDFIKEFHGKNELVQHFSFSEVIFVLDADQLYAFKNKCPHQGAKLNGCQIAEGKVICPLHQYRFDLAHGRGHGMYLEVYPLEESAEGFFLLRTYFSWFG